MIGDTPYDIEAARRAGVDTIAFRSGGWKDDDLKGAIAIYDGPWDLLEQLGDSPIGASEKMPRIRRPASAIQPCIVRVRRWRIEPRWMRAEAIGNVVAFLEVLGIDRTAVDRFAIADRA